MIKQVRSWWKDDQIPGLIGRKTVDWSIFLNGSHIPEEFHVDFLHANQGIEVPPGQVRDVTLRINGTNYYAQLRNIKLQDRTVLHIRYDGNKQLKEQLQRIFQRTYQFIAERKSDEDSKQQIRVPQGQEEYMEFYETGTPFVYEVKCISSQHSLRPNIWWVNQGKTLGPELAGGFIWAPISNDRGQTFYHWKLLQEVKVGDIILHYANGALRYVSQVEQAAVEAPKPESMSKSSWQQQGRLIKTKYHDLVEHIPLERFVDAIFDLAIPQGPINSAKRVTQGYLYRFSIEGLQIIQKLSPNSHWPDFTIFNDINIEANKEVAVTVQEFRMVSDTEVKPVLQRIDRFIKSKGFYYPPNLLESFYLSIKTKPFTILAGISGTGKTKMVKLFAEALGATTENKQFTLIPVQPDWSDSSSLIGYTDISGAFQLGEFTKVLEEACKPENRHKPFFVCLDEMNLARVEYYFSDLLSIIETRKWSGQNIITDPIVRKNNQIDQDLIIPPNVIIVGTVNMDETTHPFSKKVLDRANTLEFNDIDLQYFPETSSEIERIDLQLSAGFTMSEYLELKDAYPDHKELIQQTTQKLVEINKILEEVHAHIGFRVRDSICFFMIYNQRFGLMEENDAFDAQLMQKILPRLQGSSHALKKVLIQLLLYCEGKPFTNIEERIIHDASSLYEKYSKSQMAQEVIYRQSARKLAYMLKRMDEDGFSSFWLT